MRKKESNVSGNIDDDDDFKPAPKKNRHVRFDEKPMSPQRQSPHRPVIYHSPNLPKQKNIVEDATIKQTTVVKNRSEKNQRQKNTWW
jgi:riboflavin biosynthesis pyrimidine reductase